MPSRIFPFSNGYYYHVYNRGSEKRPIFESRRDYQRFLKTLIYYQIEGPKPKFSHFSLLSPFKLDPSKKIVEIVAYCLMPNHFHILLKQTKEHGITEFMSKFSNSYTKYYNVKYNRVGPLLQGEFKSVIIEGNEQLIHVSRYIHLNPLISGLIKDLIQYDWSSYPEYLDNSSTKISSPQDVLVFFKNPLEYQQFLLDQASYAQEINFIKHQIIDGI